MSLPPLKKLPGTYLISKMSSSFFLFSSSFFVCFMNVPALTPLGSQSGLQGMQIGASNSLGPIRKLNTLPRPNQNLIEKNIDNNKTHLSPAVLKSENLNYSEKNDIPKICDGTKRSETIERNPTSEPNDTQCEGTKSSETIERNQTSAPNDTNEVNNKSIMNDHHSNLNLEIKVVGRDEKEEKNGNELFETKSPPLFTGSSIVADISVNSNTSFVIDPISEISLSDLAQTWISKCQVYIQSFLLENSYQFPNCNTLPSQIVEWYLNCCFQSMSFFKNNLSLISLIVDIASKSLSLTLPTEHSKHCLSKLNFIELISQGICQPLSKISSFVLSLLISKLWKKTDDFKNKNGSTSSGGSQIRNVKNIQRNLPSSNSSDNLKLSEIKSTTSNESVEEMVSNEAIWNAVSCVLAVMNMLPKVISLISVDDAKDQIMRSYKPFNHLNEANQQEQQLNEKASKSDLKDNDNDNNNDNNNDDDDDDNDNNDDDHSRFTIICDLLCKAANEANHYGWASYSHKLSQKHKHNNNDNNNTNANDTRLSKRTNNETWMEEFNAVDVMQKMSKTRPKGRKHEPSMKLISSFGKRIGFYPARNPNEGKCKSVSFQLNGKGQLQASSSSLSNEESNVKNESCMSSDDDVHENSRMIKELVELEVWDILRTSLSAPLPLGWKHITERAILTSKKRELNHDLMNKETVKKDIKDGTDGQQLKDKKNDENENVAQSVHFDVNQDNVNESDEVALLYSNIFTGEVTTEHPLDGYYKNKISSLLERYNINPKTLSQPSPENLSQCFVHSQLLASLLSSQQLETQESVDVDSIRTRDSPLAASSSSAPTEAALLDTTNSKERTLEDKPLDQLAFLQDIDLKVVQLTDAFTLAFFSNSTLKSLCCQLIANTLSNHLLGWATTFSSNVGDTVSQATEHKLKRVNKPSPSNSSSSNTLLHQEDNKDEKEVTSHEDDSKLIESLNCVNSLANSLPDKLMQVVSSGLLLEAAISLTFNLTKLVSCSAKLRSDINSNSLPPKSSPSSSSSSSSSSSDLSTKKNSDALKSHLSSSSSHVPLPRNEEQRLDESMIAVMKLANTVRLMVKQSLVPAVAALNLIYEKKFVGYPLCIGILQSLHRSHTCLYQWYLNLCHTLLPSAQQSRKDILNPNSPLSKTKKCFDQLCHEIEYFGQKIGIDLTNFEINNELEFDKQQTQLLIDKNNHQDTKSISPIIDKVGYDGMGQTFWDEFFLSDINFNENHKGSRNKLKLSKVKFVGCYSDMEQLLSNQWFTMLNLSKYDKDDVLHDNSENMILDDNDEVDINRVSAMDTVVSSKPNGSQEWNHPTKAWMKDSRISDILTAWSASIRLFISSCLVNPITASSTSTFPAAYLITIVDEQLTARLLLSKVVVTIGYRLLYQYLSIKAIPVLSRIRSKQWKIELLYLASILFSVADVCSAELFIHPLQINENELQIYHKEEISKSKLYNQNKLNVNIVGNKIAEKEIILKEYVTRLKEQGTVILTAIGFIFGNTQNVIENLKKTMDNTNQNNEIDQNNNKLVPDQIEQSSYAQSCGLPIDELVKLQLTQSSSSLSPIPYLDSRSRLHKPLYSFDYIHQNHTLISSSSSSTSTSNDKLTISKNLLQVSFLHQLDCTSMVQHLPTQDKKSLSTCCLVALIRHFRPDQGDWEYPPIENKEEAEFMKSFLQGVSL